MRFPLLPKIPKPKEEPNLCSFRDFGEVGVTGRSDEVDGRVSISAKPTVRGALVVFGDVPLMLDGCKDDAVWGRGRLES